VRNINEIVDFEKAQELENTINAKIQGTKWWEDNFGGGGSHYKMVEVKNEFIFILWKLRLIEDCHYSEMSWQERYAVNRILEIIFELIEKKEEEK